MIQEEKQNGMCKKLRLQNLHIVKFSKCGGNFTTGSTTVYVTVEFINSKSLKFHKPATLYTLKKKEKEKMIMIKYIKREGSLEPTVPQVWLSCQFLEGVLLRNCCSQENCNLKLKIIH